MDFAPETFQEISDEVPSYECLQAELSRVRQEWLLQDSSVPQQQQQSLQLEQQMFELQEQLWQFEEQQECQLDLLGGQEGREHCHEQTQEAPPVLQLREQPRDEPLPAAAAAPPPVERDCSASNSGKQGEQFHLQSSLDVEMESKVVSDVLEMGYDPDMVQEVVRRHLWEHGRGFSSKLELAHAVLTELMEMLSEALRAHRLQDHRSLAREMRSKLVSDVLEMGYSRVRVRKAVEQRLREHGRGFSSMYDLVFAVQDLEEEERIKYEMRSQVVSDVLKMGFDPVMVRKAVQQHLREHRRGFKSLHELLHAALDLEEKEDRMRHSGPSQMETLGLGTPQVHKRDIDPGEQYKSEQRRLDSFATWPAGAPIHPRELAKAGFFYTGSGDRVQCFCCKGILRDWEVGDRAMSKHHKHYPSCPFIRNFKVGNVPIENQDHKYGDTAMGERERLHPHCDFVNGWETRNKPLPPPGVFPVPVTPAAVAPPTPAGRDYTDFLSPAQRDKLTRKQADPNLPRPPSTQQSVPSTLPASQSSGLYQPELEKVVEDSMKCFYCEGELQNWEPEDEPWTEHAKWCKFLQQERGDDYVQGSGVQACFPNLQAQQQAQHMRPPDEAGTGHGHSDFQPHTHDQVEDWMENESDTATGDATYHEDLDERMCKMCMEAEIDIVFISCGHLTVSVCTYSFTMPPGLSTKCANGREGGFSS